MMNIENSDPRYFRVKIMTKALTIPGKMICLGSHSAFVPAPLPPALEWTPRLIRILSDADRLIGTSRLPVEWPAIFRTQFTISDIYSVHEGALR